MIIQANVSNSGVSVSARMDISAIIEVTQEIAAIVGKPSSHSANNIENLGTKMYKFWQNEAEGKLKTSQSYVANLQQNTRYPTNSSYLHYQIEQNQLTNSGKESIAMLMEYGFDAFDMKDRILKGRAKVIVPFKHGNPGQKKYEPIPQALHDLIKTHDLLSGNKSLNHQDLINVAGEELANKLNPRNTKKFSVYSNTSTRFGENFMPVKVANGKYTQSKYGIMDRTADYTWSARKYDRMKAVNTKSGLRKETAGYITFRTISKKSAMDSWIHPGVLPKMIFHTAYNNLLPEIEPSVRSALTRDIESITN